jgi:hypothetical protein
MCWQQGDLLTFSQNHTGFKGLVVRDVGAVIGFNPTCRHHGWQVFLATWVDATVFVAACIGGQHACCWISVGLCTALDH